MKSLLNYFLILFVPLLVYSCQDDIIHNLGDVKDDIDSIIPTLKSSYIKKSKTNPQLHDDWENVTSINLNDKTSTKAPWSSDIMASIGIPESYRKDIKKADGWRMMTHTMIDYEREPNYIILYNRLRGLLKVFYYHYDESAVKNSNLVWVLNSNKSTSILQSNQLVQGLFNSTNIAVTTSNVIKENLSNFGQLNIGWNMFTVELPYGTIANDPIFTISGHHYESSTIELNGDFSGELSINFPTSGTSIFTAIKNSLEKLPGISTIIPGDAYKVMALMGDYSQYVNPKTGQNVVKGTVAGRIKLTGKEFTGSAGTVRELPGIDIKKMNKDEPLGLWSLKESPTIIRPRYILGDMELGDNPYPEHTGILYRAIEEIEYAPLQIEINPNIKNEILSYTGYCTLYSTSWNEAYKLLNVVSTKNRGTIYGYEEMRNGIVRNLPLPGWWGSDLHFPDENIGFLINNNSIMEAGNISGFVTVTVRFTYKDGSTFLSMRNYPVKISSSNKDNWGEIQAEFYNFDRVRTFNGATIYTNR